MPNDASIVYRPLVVYTPEYVLIELILDEIFPKPPSPLLVPTISGVLLGTGQCYRSYVRTARIPV